MVGVVVTQDAEPVMCQVVRQGAGIQRGLAIAGSDDDDRCVRCERLAKMVICDHDRLAAWIPTLSWNTDDRRLL